MSKSIILSIINKLLTSKTFVGIKGEFKVATKLKKLLDKDEYLINNLVIIDKQDYSSQIDHVMLTKKGIFLIEAKNYSGHIYGNDANLNWTQVLNSKTKNTFYSPVKQNNTHIYNFQQIFGNKYVYHNIVLFVNTDIKNVESEKVYDYRYFGKVYRSFPNITNDDYLIELNELYEKIKLYQKDNKVSTHEHVKRIKKKQKDISKNICPRCGEKLVIRKGKNGEFYGCSNYPKCSFTKNK